jgi:hypothetical protein
MQKSKMIFYQDNFDFLSFQTNFGFLSAITCDHPGVVVGPLHGTHGGVVGLQLASSVSENYTQGLPNFIFM